MPGAGPFLWCCWRQTSSCAGPLATKDCALPHLCHSLGMDMKPFALLLVQGEESIIHRLQKLQNRGRTAWRDHAPGSTQPPR